jgi:hypothetical protein
MMVVAAVLDDADNTKFLVISVKLVKRGDS